MNISKQKLLVIIWVLTAVLAVSVSVSIWALFFRDAKAPSAPDYPPRETEKNQKPLEEDSESPVLRPESPEGGGSITVTYGVHVTVDLSEGQVSLLYANPRASDQNVAILVMLGDLVVAESDLITPGHGVDTLALEAGARDQLRTGTYDGELVIRAYHPETGEKAMVDTRGEITLTVED